MKKTAWLIGMVIVCCGWSVAAGFAQRVQSFTLANGLTFLVYEHHQIPTFSGIIMAKVGSADEQQNETGLAHFIEHLAKKGTPIIGTRDYQRELPILEEMDRVGDELTAELDKGDAADDVRIEALQVQLAQLQEKHRELAVKEEYDKIYRENGGRGRNASTNYDTTQYFISLPANRLELWFLMESEKFKNLVMREFYSERDVINEERRMGVENSPGGFLYEQFVNAAFMNHPYRHDVIGYMHDIQTHTKERARNFFRRNYLPNNLMAAIVGDVKLAEVKRLAETYFGDMVRGPEPPRPLPLEPAQNAERRVTVYFDAEPELLIGYHSPAYGTRDNVVLEMIALILSGGESSRLNRDLVVRRKIAYTAHATANALGDRYPSLFQLQGAPQHPYGVGDLEKALYEHLERLQNEPVPVAEIRKALNQAEASLYYGVDRNLTLGMRILRGAMLFGDIDAEFHRLEQLKNVSAKEIMKTAKKIFRLTNRTVAVLQRKTAGGDQ